MDADHPIDEQSAATRVDEWAPQTPLILAAGLCGPGQKGRVIAVHFWALWDLHDKQMDLVIAAIKHRFEGWLDFYCCDIDDPRNRERLASIGIVTVPTVGVFRDGVLVHRVIGLQEERQLARELLTGLTAPTLTRETHRPWWKLF